MLTTRGSRPEHRMQDRSLDFRVISTRTALTSFRFSDNHSKPARTPVCNKDALLFSFFRPQAHRHHIPFFRTIASLPEHSYAGRCLVFAVLSTATAPQNYLPFSHRNSKPPEYPVFREKEKNPMLISSYWAVLVLNFVLSSLRYGYSTQRRIMR